MSWIDDEFELIDDLRAEGREAPSPADVAAASRRWWTALRETLERDLHLAADRGIAADLAVPDEDHYRINSVESGLRVELEFDPDARTVRFEFTSDGQRAGAPEGGIFSLRPRPSGGVQAFYSDEPINRDKLSETVLKPVLFPTVPSERI
jgi:hypothetical protein